MTPPGVSKCSGAGEGGGAGGAAGVAGLGVLDGAPAGEAGGGGLETAAGPGLGGFVPSVGLVVGTSPLPASGLAGEPALMAGPSGGDFGPATWPAGRTAGAAAAGFLLFAVWSQALRSSAAT